MKTSVNVLKRNVFQARAQHLFTWSFRTRKATVNLKNISDSSKRYAKIFCCKIIKIWEEWYSNWCRRTFHGTEFTRTQTLLAWYGPITYWKRGKYYKCIGYFPRYSSFSAQNHLIIIEEISEKAKVKLQLEFFKTRLQHYQIVSEKLILIGSIYISLELCCSDRFAIGYIPKDSTSFELEIIQNDTHEIWQSLSLSPHQKKRHM